MAAPVGVWAQQDVVASKISSAIEARDKGDYGAAKELLEGCAKPSSPNDITYLTCTLELGYTLQAGVKAGVWDQSRWPEAEADFRSVADKGDAPRKALALNNLAFLYEAEGKVALALQTMQRVATEVALSAVNPGERSAYRRNLAYFYRISGRLDEAYTAILKALAEGAGIDESLVEAARIVNLAGGKCPADPTPFPPINRIAATPQAVILRAGGTAQFSAINTRKGVAVKWGIEPSVGSIDARGFYRAPPSIAADQVISVHGDIMGLAQICSAVMLTQDTAAVRPVAGPAGIIWLRPFSMTAEIAAVLRGNGRPDAAFQFALPYLRTAPLNETGRLLFQEVLAAVADAFAGSAADTKPHWVALLLGSSGDAGSSPKAGQVQVRPWVRQAFEELDRISAPQWWTSAEGSLTVSNRRATHRGLPHLSDACLGLGALSQFVLKLASAFRDTGEKQAALNAYAASWRMDRDNLDAALGFASFRQGLPFDSITNRIADQISTYYYHRLPGVHLLPRADNGNAQFVAPNWTDLLQLYLLLGTGGPDARKHLERGIKVRSKIQDLGGSYFTPRFYMELAKLQESSPGKIGNRARAARYYYEAADEYAGLATSAPIAGSDSAKAVADEFFHSAAAALTRATADDPAYERPLFLVNGSDEKQILLNLLPRPNPPIQLTVDNRSMDFTIDPSPVLPDTNLHWLRPAKTIEIGARPVLFTLKTGRTNVGWMTISVPRNTKPPAFEIKIPSEGDTVFTGRIPDGFDAVRVEVTESRDQVCDPFMTRTTEVERGVVDQSDGSFRIALRRRLVAGQTVAVTPIHDSDLIGEQTKSYRVESDSILPDSVFAYYHLGEVTRLGVPGLGNNQSAGSIANVENAAGIAVALGSREFRKWSLACADYRVTAFPLTEVYAEFRFTPVLRPVIPAGASKAGLQGSGNWPVLEVGIVSPSLHRRVASVQGGRKYAPYLAPMIKGGYEFAPQATPTSRDFRFYAFGGRLGIIRFAQPEGGRFRITPNLLDVTYGRWENFYLNGNANYSARNRLEVRVRGVLPISWLGIPFLPAPTLEFTTNRGAGINDNRLDLGYEVDLGVLAKSVSRILEKSPSTPPPKSGTK